MLAETNMIPVNEQTLELELHLLIPGLQNQQDGCIDRLLEALRGREGIHHVHLETERTPQMLCLHYDPAQVNMDGVRQTAEGAGAKIAERYHHETLTVEGLDCSDCVIVVQHGLGRMKGMLDVAANFPAGTVQVEYDSSQVERKSIEHRLGQLGYPVQAKGWRAWMNENGEVLNSLIAGALILIGWIGARFLGLPAIVETVFYIVAAVLAGRHIAVHAVHAIREREFDTDLLMLAAALGAFALREFAEGALLLFLFSLGHALEERALDRARGAIRSLASMAPKTARVRRDGAVVEVAIEDVRLEEIVLVPPGERIAVDGQVTAGESYVDQAPVTGESIPVEKGSGAAVFAGTVNGSGALEVRATRLARDSTLQRVMRMVEEAQESQSPTQLKTERFMRVFVPVILIVDFLIIVVPPLFGVPFAVSFERAMMLLVAASPCALALGTPSAILAGVARAARSGVLLKGGVHLENLGRVKVMAFDKTGTLTSGRPELTDLFPANGWAEDELLTLAAAVERNSAHPLARSVAQGAEERGLARLEAQGVQALPGRGLSASINGRMVQVGSAKLLEEVGVFVEDHARRWANDLESAGKTVMLVAVDGIFAGGLGVADVARPEARQTVAALRELGLKRLIVLTGDNAQVAEAVRAQTGVDEALANLLPEDKQARIRELTESGEIVAMIGDGVNDAPALATATVGIAMGGAGSDVALETADVALMSDDLSRLPFAVGLGRAAGAIILQNLIVAMGVIVLLVAASLTGLVSLGVAVFLHEGSTVAVVLNSLRLLGFQRNEKGPVISQG